MMIDLALTWAIIIAVGIILYVFLGGYDMGIGLLTLFLRDEHERDLMLSAIMPVWDGNQTWLVFGGSALYGAFPQAFSFLLPRLYLPIFVMVLALLFRGIALEFRMKANRTKKIWNECFGIGSLVATIMQGIVLGTFVQGFKLTKPNTLPSELYQWINFFGLFCALGLICGYALLGSNYLIIKFEGTFQQKFFQLSKRLQYCILLAFIGVSIWSPFLDPGIMKRWFDIHNMPYLALLPLLTFFLFYLHHLALLKKWEYLPFWSLIGMFLMCYIGFIISLYPYIVPRHLTYLESASDPSALFFMLVGAAIMFPPLLYYTYHAHHVFRGKITEKLEY